MIKVTDSCIFKLKWFLFNFKVFNFCAIILTVTV